jgi:hypothetical protein
MGIARGGDPRNNSFRYTFFNRAIDIFNQYELVFYHDY